MRAYLFFVVMKWKELKRKLATKRDWKNTRWSAQFAKAKRDEHEELDANRIQYDDFERYFANSSLTSHGLRAGTDKAYWHRYTDFYEPFFRALKQRVQTPSILEIGVLRGASVQLYLDYLNEPKVIGVDLLPESASWPNGDNISYFQIDQSDRLALQNMIDEIGESFDLIVDDGGHLPEQQYNTLMTCFESVKPGGIYILEDLHTSMPGHVLNRQKLFDRMRGNERATCYQILLMLKHYRDMESVGHQRQQEMKVPLSALFSQNDVAYLDEMIESIQFYKRVDLPLRCWQCATSDFDYASLHCSCGTPLLDSRDSMSAVITRR